MVGQNSISVWNIDTAWPLVRYDLPGEPLVKRIFHEQIVLRETTPGLDPRPTTIERLMREYGWSYLEAEAALGRMVQEAVRTRLHEALRHYDDFGECIFCTALNTNCCRLPRHRCA